MNAAGKIRKSSYLGWFLLTCFCVFQFSLQGSIGILADSLKDSMHLDARSLSLLSSSFYYSYLLMQIPVGFIFDRYSIRWIVTLALLLVALSLGLFAMSTSAVLAIFARILMGLACSFGFLGLVVATGKWFPLRLFALMVAATECIGMFGVAALNTMLSKLVISHDWRYASWVCAAIAFALALALFLFVPGEEPTVEEKLPSLPFLRSLRSIASYREVWFGGLYAFALFSVVTVFAGLWGIPFLMASAKLDLVSATALVSMIYIGSALSSPLVGWLSGFIKPSSLMIPSAFLTAILMLLIIFVNKTSLPVLYVLLFALGFGCSVYQVPFAIVNAAVPARVKGLAMGVTNIICMSSGPILQPVIGFFLAYSGNYSGNGFEGYPVRSFQTALLFLPLCLGLATFLALKLRKKA